MSGRPIEELAVDVDVERVAQRAERRRRLFRSRLISLGITLAIVIGFAVWLRSRGQPAGLWLSAVVVVISVGWAAMSYMIYRRARRELAELRPGTAIRVARGGVEVAGLSSPWSAVASITTVKGGLGRSPRLVLTLRDGRTSSVALDHVTVLPATVDSTVRAYSGGRHGVDLTALDT
ncbi:MAG TPA: hypothetical protein VFP34_10585 [Microlunatus sp.]|nr:hypothetical protein [Microlunatus sp.]